MILKEEIKLIFKEFKIGTKIMFKEFFNKETNKKQRANMWTFARLITPLATVVCSIIGITTGILPFLMASGIIAGMGAITDYFDGKSSRKHNSASEYGKLLDQVSDKVFAGIIGINLLFLNPAYIIVLLGEVIISSVNVYYKFKYKNLESTSTKIGKIKEWPLFFTLAFGYFSTLNPSCLVISNISIAITFVTQLLTTNSYITRNKKQIKSFNQFSNNILYNEIGDNDKTKTLELKKNNVISNNISKIDEYKKLRDDLNDLNQINDNTPINQILSYQKKLKK